LAMAMLAACSESRPGSGGAATAASVDSLRVRGDTVGDSVMARDTAAKP